jgi:hypothetical protein
MGMPKNYLAPVLGFEGTRGLPLQLQLAGVLCASLKANMFGLRNRYSLWTRSWNHIAVTVDSSAARFYLNGELMVRVTLPFRSNGNFMNVLHG